MVEIFIIMQWEWYLCPVFSSIRGPVVIGARSGGNEKNLSTKQSET